MVAENRRTTGYTRSYTHTHAWLGLMCTTKCAHKHKHNAFIKTLNLPPSLSELFLIFYFYFLELFLWDFEHSICLTHAVTWTHTWTQTRVPSYPNTSVSPHIIRNQRTWPHFLCFRYESTRWWYDKKPGTFKKWSVYVINKVLQYFESWSTATVRGF